MASDLARSRAYPSFHGCLGSAIFSIKPHVRSPARSARALFLSCLRRRESRSPSWGAEGGGQLISKVQPYLLLSRSFDQRLSLRRRPIVRRFSSRSDLTERERERERERVSGERTGASSFARREKLVALEELFLFDESERCSERFLWTLLIFLLLLPCSVSRLSSSSRMIGRKIFKEIRALLETISLAISLIISSSIDNLPKRDVIRTANQFIFTRIFFLFSFFLFFFFYPFNSNSTNQRFIRSRSSAVEKSIIPTSASMVN